MNPTAIYSKTGKGVQEASGKTSILSRADRAVLSAIDGKATVGELNLKFDKIPEAKLHQLIEQMDKDGFIRATTQGTAPAQKTVTMRPGAAPAKPGGAASGEELDFTALSIPTIKAPVPGAPETPPPAQARPAATPPKPAAPKPAMDLAAAARAESAKAELDNEFDFLNRQKAEPQLGADAEAKVREQVEEKAKTEAAAKAPTLKK